jgi:hypothetical protein
VCSFTSVIPATQEEQAEESRVLRSAWANFTKALFQNKVKKKMGWGHSVSGPWFNSEYIPSKRKDFSVGDVVLEFKLRTSRLLCHLSHFTSPSIFPLKESRQPSQKPSWEFQFLTKHLR